MTFSAVDARKLGAELEVGRHQAGVLVVKELDAQAPGVGRLAHEAVGLEPPLGVGEGAQGHTSHPR